MLNSAKQVNLPVSGYYGGILHDEAKIQEDLVIKVKGGTNELIGMLCWMDKKSFISGDAPGKILLKIWWRSSPSTFDRLITSSSDSLLNFQTNAAHFLQEIPVQYQPNTCSHVLFLILISCVFSSPMYADYTNTFTCDINGEVFSHNQWQYCNENNQSKFY
jgi:hypothetical protein